MLKQEKTRELRTAMCKFLEYAGKLTEEELLSDRTFNELVLNIETAKFYSDILCGDKENPIANYKY